MSISGYCGRSAGAGRPPGGIFSRRCAVQAIDEAAHAPRQQAAIPRAEACPCRARTAAPPEARRRNTDRGSQRRLGLAAWLRAPARARAFAGSMARSAVRLNPVIHRQQPSDRSTRLGSAGTQLRLEQFHGAAGDDIGRASVARTAPRTATRLARSTAMLERASGRNSIR